MINYNDIQKFEYFYFYRILSNFNYKTVYKNQVNLIMERNGKKLGIWGVHKNKIKEGIFEDGKWSWLNTINTHTYCFYELYHSLTNEEKNKLDFDNDTTNSIITFWGFIDKNFDLYFTKNITNKYYDILNFRSSQSWSKGIVTNIFFIMSLPEIFGEDLINKEYSFERGDYVDLNGVDFVIELKNNIKKTVQLKSGKHYYDGDFYILDSSANDLKSPADFYCFFDISNFTSATNVLMFKNQKDKIFKKDGFTYFPKELLFKHFVNTMTIPQALKNTLWFCGPKKINFELNLDSDENSVIICPKEEKRIIININNIYDDSLGELLEKKLMELCNIFQ
jgi:hypothetical protein